MGMIDTALKARDKGLSVIPIIPGNKAPSIATWTPYQTECMGSDDIRRNFTDDSWFGIIAGAVSGNLEVLDFDIPEKHDFKAGQTGTAPLFQPFVDFLIEHGHEDLINSLIWMRSKSGGMVLIYRCPDATISGNTKLAERDATPEELEKRPGQRRYDLIETRGEKGYFVCAPTPGYKLLKGTLSNIPAISAEDRELLLSVARFLSPSEPTTYAPERSNPSAQRPGDAYNLKASWEEILVPHGWQRGKKSGNRTHWTRPGKKVKDGNSATTGNGPNDLLYVFTSAAYPFEPSTGYSKFAAYCYLNHNRDFHHGAQVLKSEGYGESRAQKQTRESPPATTGRGLTLRQFEANSFQYAKPTYLVEPYLQIGKCILLDADGGTGKSCLCAAWSACLTSGRHPLTGEDREPIRVLYLHRGEDTDEEITTVFAANGGNFENWFLFSDKSLQFDSQGLADLEATIQENQIQLVVVDALFYFLSTLMENTYNALPAMAVMEQLNGIAERQKCTFWNIRHTKKGNPDTKASDLGMGSVQFRNSHRGQLMLRFHPEEPGVIVCTDEKGSLLNPKGKPFCYRRVDLEIMYLPDVENPFGGKKGRSKTAECEEWLRQTLMYGTTLRTAVLERGVDAGFSNSLVYEAAQAIGVARMDQPRQPGEGSGRRPTWWARPGYDWSSHEWGDPYA